MKGSMQELLTFIRKQGVVGLATGFILGGAISKLVSSLVEDLINPLLGILLGKAGDLSNYSLWVGGAEVRWGNFVAVLIDFLVIALVVYVILKVLQLEKLDIKVGTQEKSKK